MNVKTIVVVATVVVSVLAAIYGWKLVKENCTGTVAGIEMTQTNSDERMGDDDLYMNIKPYYPDYMPYNMPVSFSTYKTYDGGVSIPLHTSQRATHDKQLHSFGCIAYCNRYRIRWNAYIPVHFN